MSLVNALIQKDSEENVLELLANICVCKRCVVRIFRGNYGDYGVYETEKPVQKGGHCCTCLGILEGHTLYSVGKKAADKMKELNYDSPTFHLGIAVPRCVTLRQLSVITYLRDNGTSNIIRELPGVRNVAKTFISKLIERLTEKTIDPQSSLLIKLDFNFPGDVKEMSKLDSLLQYARKGRSQPSNKLSDQPYRAGAIQKVVKGLSDAQVKKYAVCPPQSVSDACSFSINMFHSSIFIGGRYNKFSRNLSQTPWFADGARRRETSTLELIGERLKQFTRGADIRFQSAGLQDADVRVLGKGRPFSIEITDPKITVVSTDQMVKLQSQINSSTDLIGVRDLQLVARAGVELMKKWEEEKVKTYKAKLWCPEPIADELIEELNEMSDIWLLQKTPIRLLHRHPVLTRVRKVHEINMKRIDEKDCYELDLKTQAYIKEFVHGDFGRTEPSLRTILNVPVDILELDVMSIETDWPPELINSRIIENGTAESAGKATQC